MSEEKLIFGRISLTTLVKAQEELLKYVSNANIIDPFEFSRKYNKATLGLVNERDHIIRTMIRLNKLEQHRHFLKIVLPMLFSRVLRKALDYYGEVRKYVQREAPADLKERIREVLE